MSAEKINDQILDGVTGGADKAKKFHDAKCPLCVGSGGSASLYTYKGNLVCAQGHVFPGSKSALSAEALIRTDPEFAKEALKNCK